MGKDRRKRAQQLRDGTRFLAIPHVVLSSPGWRAAGHVARSLLLDIAAQHSGTNNGRLVATGAYLEPLGWRSHDTVSRALRELQDCGLILETRKGGKNLPTWFALTWCALGKVTGLDIDAGQYRRGGYMAPDKNATAAPSGGTRGAAIAPSGGVVVPLPAPPDGAVRARKPAALPRLTGSI